MPGYDSTYIPLLSVAILIFISTLIRTQWVVIRQCWRQWIWVHLHAARPHLPLGDQVHKIRLKIPASCTNKLPGYSSELRFRGRFCRARHDAHQTVAVAGVRGVPARFITDNTVIQCNNSGIDYITPFISSGIVPHQGKLRPPSVHVTTGVVQHNTSLAYLLHHLQLS